MMHRLHTTRGLFPAFASPVFSGDRDRGVAETVGYVQLLIAAGALLHTAYHQSRGWVHYAFAAAFVLVIADDSLELHENWGGALADAFGFQSALGLRGQDFGELLVWALLGLPVLIAVGVTWIFSSPRARRQALVIVGGLALLVFFAAVFDGLGPASGLWGWSARTRYLLSLTESGGELAAQSVIMLSALYFAFRQKVLSRKR